MKTIRTRVAQLEEQTNRLWGDFFDKNQEIQAELLRVEFPSGYRLLSLYDKNIDACRSQAIEEGYKLKRPHQSHQELWVKP